MLTLDFTPPPTVAAFMQSEAFGRLIVGPVGSGKTTGCIFELLRRAIEQKPAADGVRYTRFAIVRQTLKQLRDTVAKDITSWLGPLVHFKVSENTFYIERDDIKSEWLLIPLEDEEDQARLLSAQLTGVWCSELIEMDVSILNPLSGRVGRYPRGTTGTCTWQGIIADTNMPTEGSDWHHFMTDEMPADFQVWVQPGGLDEHAENLEWLNQTDDTMLLPVDDPQRKAQGRQYYERLCRGNNQAWIDRYVHAKFGEDPSGTAVFRESFHMNYHSVSDGLLPIASQPLLIGQDFGRDPWSLIAQLDPMGRLIVLEEVPAEDIGLELHVQRALKPALSQARYLGMSVAMVGDPAGRAKDSIFEETSFDALKRMGFPAFPAPTNDLDARLRAVDAFLMRQVIGKPALLIDRGRCPKLTSAMNGGYRYANTRTGLRKTLPDKNEFSHVADCLQYLCLVGHGGQVPVITRTLRRPMRRMSGVSARAWT